MRKALILIDINTGLALGPRREFDIPDDDHIIAATEEGTAWVAYTEGSKLHPRSGEQTVPDQIAKPMPYVEGTTVYFDGWKITGTYVPPTAEEIAQQRIDLLTERVEDMDTLLAEAIGLLFAVSFAQQNEIRVLQGNAPIPATVAGAEAFLNGVDALPRLANDKLKVFLVNALDQVEP